MNVILSLFSRRGLLILLQAVIGLFLLACNVDGTDNAPIDQQSYSAAEETHADHVKIDAEIAAQAGIRTRTAGPARIERHLQVYGRLVTPPDGQALVRARFPGIATRIFVNVGDRVAEGDVLAIIESNESLQSYELRAPIAGTIQKRSITNGESTTDSPLFTLINDEQLWAEFKVFPSHRADVQMAQPVHIKHNNHLHESHITNITYASDSAPFVVARSVLHNSHHDLAPGDLVVGEIDVELVDVPLAVDNRALQRYHDEFVVFVRTGDVYELRTLELGRSDGRYTEVLDGLKPGDHYVVENSYLIKADLEKASASHDH